jgi:prepilin-type N-terminal cleavage/methylation domain-containing protein
VTRALSNEKGMTLIELLIALSLSLMLVGAAAIAFTGALRDVSNTQQTFADSHDAQLVSTYLPIDVQAAQTAVDAPTTASGCSGATTPTTSEPNVLRMGWSETVGSTTTNYAVAYQIKHDAPEDEWTLVRIACENGGTARNLIVAHDLLEPSDSHWAALNGTQGPADLSQLACGRIVVTLIQSSGYSYTLSGNYRKSTSTTCPGATTTTTEAETTTTLVPTNPVFIGASMYDNDHDGLIDQLIANYTKTLNSSCDSGWSINNAPAGTTIGTPTVSGTDITIPLNEGTAKTTAVGSLTVSFAKPAACNALGSESNAVPADAAPPVIIDFATPAGGSGATVGKFEPTNSLQITFSEPVTGLTASVTTTITRDNGSNPASRLTIPGLTTTNMSLGDTNYIDSNKTATFASSGVSNPGTGVVTVTLGAVCAGDCGKLNAAASAPLTFTPASTILDASANAATGSFPKTGQLF